jgi:hypothetical protein
MALAKWFILTHNDLKADDLHSIANFNGVYVKFDTRLKNEFLIWRNHWPEYASLLNYASVTVTHFLLNQSRTL